MANSHEQIRNKYGTVSSFARHLASDHVIPILVSSLDASTSSERFSQRLGNFFGYGMQLRLPLVPLLRLYNVLWKEGPKANVDLVAACVMEMSAAVFQDTEKAKIANFEATNLFNSMQVSVVYSDLVNEYPNDELIVGFRYVQYVEMGLAERIESMTLV